MNAATLFFVGENAAFPAFVDSCRNITVSCQDLQMEMIANLLAMDTSPIAVLLATTVFLLCFGFGTLCGWAASTLNICLINQASRPRPRQGRRPAVAKKRPASDDGQAAALDELPLPPLPILDGAAVEDFFQNNEYETYESE